MLDNIQTYNIKTNTKQTQMSQMVSNTKLSWHTGLYRYHSWLPRPRALYFYRRWLVSLFVCLLAGLRKNYSTDFHSIGPRKKRLDFGDNSDYVTSGLLSLLGGGSTTTQNIPFAGGGGASQNPRQSVRFTRRLFFAGSAATALLNAILVTLRAS